MNPPVVSVLGGGSFGTALGHLAAGNGCPTRLWVRSEQLAQQINENQRNERYLPGLPLAAGIRAQTDMEQAVADADLVLIAVPSSAFRLVCRRLARFLSPEAHVLSTTKGVETLDRKDGEDIEKICFRLMSQVLVEELLRRSLNNPLGVIAGPNLAREIVQGRYAGAVVSSPEEETRQLTRRGLECAHFRLHESDDLFGVELGGVMKNIYAIAFGLAATAEVGKNAEGLLLTQSIREITMFSEAIGGESETFFGLSGIGDLFATCTSPLSRNFNLGRQLAKGISLEKAQETLGQTTEGVNALSAVLDEAARRELALPLAESLHQLLYKNLSFDKLMRRLTEDN